MYRAKFIINTLIVSAVLAAMAAGIPGARCYGAVAQAPHVKAYSNRELGLRFEYPERYFLKEFLAPDGGFINILIGIRQGAQTRWLMNIEPVDMGSYPREMFDQARVTAKDFAQEISKLRCDADGPDSSVRCTGVASIEPVVTSRGLPGYEIFLNRVTEFHDEDGSTKSENDIRGPVYAFDISGGGTVRILMVEPAEEAPSEAESIREVINSLRVEGAVKR